MMRAVGDRADGHRLSALIVLLWRAGLRISEALALQESDLDRAEARCSSREEKAASGAKSEWTAGHGTSSAHGSRSAASSQSERCLCDPWSDRRPALGGFGRAQTATSRSRRSGRQTALCATPAAARPRGRDGARGRAAGRDPAPARPRQPRHHQHLPTGHRQPARSSAPCMDDHRRRSRPPPGSRWGAKPNAFGSGRAYLRPARRRTPGWRIRGPLDRAPRALPSCLRRHLPPTAFAWLRMSGSVASDSVADVVQHHRAAPEGVTGRARISWPHSATCRVPVLSANAALPAGGEARASAAPARMACRSGAGAVGRCCQAWMTFRMGWMVGGWSSTPSSRRIGTNPRGPHVSRVLGFPDVEHFDLAVRFDRDVFEASRRGRHDRLRLSRRIVSSYFSGVKPVVLEVSADCHVCPLCLSNVRGVVG